MTNEDKKTNNRVEVYKSDVNQANDPRRIFINYIKKENSTILDVGCACGDFANETKKVYPKSSIYGIEYNLGSVEIAKQTGCFIDIWNEDLDCLDTQKYEKYFNSFDYISFGDVLEHVKNPLDILKKFKKFLKPEGEILISLPNTAHASIKANLLLNNFDYTDIGLLDITHIRFFTYKTIAKLCYDAELEINECNYTDWCGIYGTQLNNPYKKLPWSIGKFILSDKFSHICQFVISAKINENITLEQNKDFIKNAINEKMPDKKVSFIQVIKTLSKALRKKH